jgi:glycosyltransferase involved in cell wall biosynthesis
MRIGFVAHRAHPAVGGMESYLRHLTRALAQRHDVRVVAQGIDTGPRSLLADSLRPPPEFERFEDDGVHIEPLRVPAARRALLAPLATQVAPGLRRYAWGSPRLAANRLYARVVGPVLAEQLRGCDVVHLWGSDLLGAAAVHAARLLGVPVVGTPFVHAGNWGDSESFAVTYRALDRVCALLHTDADVYAKLGVAPDRIEVVGVCSPPVPTAQPAADAAPLVLFLGVRRPYKGYELLLEAAPLVPGATFAFVGPGAPLPETAGVIDVGEVDDEERAAWLAAADLLVLPSEAEIFPVSILEAWSAGVPVVTSDIPTLSELVERSRGGVAVARDVEALAGAIRALLADDARRRELADNGRAFWRTGFTVDAVAARHEALYAAVQEGFACAA